MLSFLHTDTIKIYRMQQNNDEFGGVVENLEKVGTCKGRLSREQLAPTSQHEANRTATQRFRLFTNIDVDIKQNDTLEVMRHGHKYRFVACAPLKYYNFIPHQEIELSEAVENEF